MKIVTPCSTGFGLLADPWWDSEPENRKDYASFNTVIKPYYSFGIKLAFPMNSIEESCLCASITKRFCGLSALTLLSLVVHSYLPYKSHSYSYDYDFQLTFYAYD